MNRNVRDTAVRLRRQGHSYNEISTALKIPKSTLSGWLRDIPLSSKAQERLQKRYKISRDILIERNKRQTVVARERAQAIQNASMRDIGVLSDRERMLIGAALYWGEGYKRLIVRGGFERTGHVIGFTNADPDMIRFFVNFCRTILDVPDEKFGLWVRLYNPKDDDKAKKYWRKITGLSAKNFKPSTYLVSISSKRKRSFNRLPFGTLQIVVADTQKFHRLMGWIAGLKKMGYT